ncbi:hypothetical protein FQN57_001382 [Myotisia sp. PD_48]|nr:hypothetical protein FQN57_001382 [Myotisia sp. PD_48]
MVAINALDARELPSPKLRELYKTYRSLKLGDIDRHPSIVDLGRLDNDALPEGLYLESSISPEKLASAFDSFMGTSFHTQLEAVPVYAHRDIPGLQIIPSLLIPQVQVEVLSRLFHRDLSDPKHQTNIHLHYHVPYSDATTTSEDPATTGNETKTVTGTSKDRSFFNQDPSRLVYPKDSLIHSPISFQSLLNRKLRWMTLGGQYDWTEKRYPREPPPPFPPDISDLLHRIFPTTLPEAAIVNVYSPGDTLHVHRDVSEECDTGLISVSFGCEGLFMVSNLDNSDFSILRLRSGDAVYMSGTARFAWHGVPKIIPGTCPSWLQDWPAEELTPYHSHPNISQHWRGWMAGKRINFNVRQMKPTGT